MEQSKTRKRQRARLSCAECHRRKVRCDRNDPCRRCVDAKVCCSYDDDKDTRPAVSRRRRPEDVPTPAIWPSPASTRLPCHAVQDKPDPPVSRSQGGSQEGLPASQDHISETTSFGQANVRGILSKARFLGNTHPISTYRQCDDLHSTNSNFLPVGRRVSAWSPLLVEAQALIASSKATARIAKRQHACSIPMLDDVEKTLPRREICDVIVSHYLRIFEDPFRILHRVIFHREYSGFWENSAERRPLFTIIICLVLSIGTHFCHDESIEALIRPHIPQWLQIAQSWLSSARGKETATISALQAQCLLSVSLQLNEIKPQRVWLFQGTLLRNAMYMGLHRDGSHFPDMPFYHAEMRRRLWSTILELDLQASMDLGMMPTMDENGFDSLPPSNWDDETFDETTKIVPRPAPESASTHSSLQIVLRNSLTTRMKVARLMNDSFNDPAYEEVLQVTDELKELLATTKARLESLSTETEISAVHHNLMSYLTHRFMLAMHRPFAARAFQDRRYHYSRKVCIDNALVLLSPEPDPDFHRMLLTSAALFRHIMHHAAILLCLEIIGQVKEDLSDKKLLQLRQQDRARLLAPVKQMPLITAERLCFGETNVKSHVFLCMAIARIEALEQGLDVTTHVLTASIMSARHALRILQERSSTSDGEIDHALDSMDSGMGDMSADDSIPFTTPLNDDLDLDLGDMTSWIFSNWVDEYPL